MDFLKLVQNDPEAALSGSCEIVQGVQDLREGAPLIFDRGTAESKIEAGEDEPGPRVRLEAQIHAEAAHKFGGQVLPTFSELPRGSCENPVRHIGDRAGG